MIGGSDPIIYGRQHVSMLNVIDNNITLDNLTFFSREMMELNANVSRNKIEYQIPQNGDVVQLNYICITCNNINLEQFNEIMKKSVIIILIGGDIVNSYDYDLLSTLNPTTQFHNKFIITIPSDFTLKNIPMISLQCHNVFVDIIGFEHNFNSADILMTYTFLNSQDRQNLAQHQHDYMIQQIFKIGSVDEEINEKNIIMTGENLSKGFFIKGNISNIKEFEIRFNGRTRQKMTRTMIETYCHVIKNDLLYYSFNGQNNYSSLNKSSFNGSYNLSLIDDLQCVISTYNTCMKYDIYTISWNVLKTVNGMGALIYTSAERHYMSLNRPHIIESNTPLQIATWQMQTSPLHEPHNCSICFENINNDYVVCSCCNNNFDYECLKQWLDINSTCPLCRMTWCSNIRFLQIES